MPAMAGSWGGWLLSNGQVTSTDNWWTRAFIVGGSGLLAETAQSALTAVLKLVMQWSDLCLVSTVNLLF